MIVATKIKPVTRSGGRRPHVAAAAMVELVRPADPGWAWSGVNLWVVAAVLLGVVLATRGRTRSPYPAGPQPPGLRGEQRSGGVLTPP